MPTLAEAYAVPADDDDALQRSELETMVEPVTNAATERNKVYNVAPGEGFDALGIVADTYAEELSFPTIFCGYPRPDNSQREVPLSYADICNSELLRADRRCAHITNLFFKVKKLQAIQVLQAANVRVRKANAHGKPITASQVGACDLWGYCGILGKLRCTLAKWLVTRARERHGTCLGFLGRASLPIKHSKAHAGLFSTYY